MGYLSWWQAISAIGVAGMLAAEALEVRWLAWVCKPTAAAAFIAAALSRGALGSSYGVAVLVALCLSFCGDVLLIPKNQAIFRAGILAFLAGHLAFGVAFVVRGVSPVWALGAASVLGVVGLPLGGYFVRSAPEKLRAAVAPYIVVLSLMVALAFGTFGRGGGPLIVVAAVAFYLSDISVAIVRFVRPGLLHRAWGAPLYFAAQHVFVLTLDGAP